ncbi:MULTISPECIES: protein kinase domain-containing protein [Streptomyces]|uniref:protein kinase domain-containing protein n=1 Tax=Streptomyces TaxID=1883 RepID=UPI0027E452F0|nr:MULTISPECIES: protein kinase [Streptomyces]
MKKQLRSLGAALGKALQTVHACGLAHGDLKPGNIIMADDGPRVLEFGIARAVESTRLTATGAAFGTLGYLAPEQAQGDEVGGAADVFALGAVLVAVAGGSAFGIGTPWGLCTGRCTSPQISPRCRGSRGRWSPPASPRTRPAVPRPRSSWARSGRTRTRTTDSLSPPLTGRASHRLSRSSLPPIPAASTNLSGAPWPNPRARPA